MLQNSSIYSLKSRSEIESLIANHQGQEYLRSLQKALAEEMTIRVHGEEALELAEKATQVFFGKGSAEDLSALNEPTLKASLEGMEKFEVDKEKLEKGTYILDLLAVETSIFPSKGEARKMIAANGFSINKEKYTNVDGTINMSAALHERYVILQKGKKNYFVIELI